RGVVDVVAVVVAAQRAGHAADLDLGEAAAAIDRGRAGGDVEHVGDVEQATLADVLSGDGGHRDGHVELAFVALACGDGDRAERGGGALVLVVGGGAGI